MLEKQVCRFICLRKLYISISEKSICFFIVSDLYTMPYKNCPVYAFEVLPNYAIILIRIYALCNNILDNSAKSSNNKADLGKKCGRSLGGLMKKLILNCGGAPNALDAVKSAGWDGVFTGWAAD